VAAPTGGVRSFLTVVILTASSVAQAQHPLGLQYLPGGAPPHGPPVRSRALLSPSQAMLDAHNAVRARVGVPPLVWSAQLADVAQDWAKHLISTGALSHRPNNRYGENIYAIAGGTASPAQVVNDWAGEARGYDIRSNTCSGVCGHYTQIVWSKTRAVGCAVARSQQREVWVCNYDPPGNVIGFRPY